VDSEARDAALCSCCLACSWRCSGAEVVTFNIGINDLGHASRSYENGTCGGAHNEQCLRAAVDEVEENWDAIIEEIGVFEPYLDEVNRYIAGSAAGNSIPTPRST
jgi:hypothetical protein